MACIFIGVSFAELGENTLLPAIETARKVSSVHALSSYTLCEPSCLRITAAVCVLQAVPLITADEFQAMSSQDNSELLIVLDVRSKDEYQQG